MKTYVMSALLLLALSAPALAQDAPAVEVAGGYSFLRSQSAEQNLHGWMASVAGNVNRWFGVAGEIEGTYASIDVADADLGLYSFMAGPRISSRGDGSMTPFFQIMVGGTRMSMSVLDESASTTFFAIQPGGGVDFWMTPSVGLRTGADYRRIFDEDASANLFRFHFGVVVSGGGRR